MKHGKKKKEYNSSNGQNKNDMSEAAYYRQYGYRTHGGAKPPKEKVGG